jgi:hypothetical protein
MALFFGLEVIVKITLRANQATNAQDVSREAFRRKLHIISLTAPHVLAFAEQIMNLKFVVSVHANGS